MARLATLLACGGAAIGLTLTGCTADVPAGSPSAPSGRTVSSAAQSPAITPIGPA